MSTTARPLTLVVVLILTLGSLGASALQTPWPPTPPPQVPERYAFLYGDRRLREEAQRTFPIESIAIERTGCFGTCPVYTATLRVDETASYSGGRHAPMFGSRKGRISFDTFARLAMFVEKSGFLEMQDRYTAGHTDDETVIVTVRMRDGRRKTVRDYGRYGPPDLWILQQAIDAVVDRIPWESR